MLLLFFSMNLFSQDITLADAIRAAEKHILQKQKNNYSIGISTEILEENKLIAYLFELSPYGYVIVASNTDLTPIPAYSFENNFGEITSTNTLLKMIKTNLKAQLDEIDRSNTPLKIANHKRWQKLKNSTIKEAKDDFQQWPSEGNGWLKTNWTQTAPYSDFCPIDPVTSARSYTGCPATAMSQILNFHKTMNGTRFNQNDDYYHNYAGRQYQIDNDYSLHGFPSFEDLNYYLDTLQAHWDFNSMITNTDKAALNFACGVAAKQVFTSEGSGTFSVSQAYDAYQRFGFNQSVLLEYNDTTIIHHLSQNMKDTLPAHLAIVDASWSTGHNVVVDGYNTDGYFHVNFGWGGSSNGWYLLPQEMPMSLTTFEGVVVDINKKISASIANSPTSNTIVNTYPNPCSNMVEFSSNITPNSWVIVKIWDITGLLLLEKSIFTDNSYQFTMDLSDIKIKDGILIFQISSSHQPYFGKLIKKGK